MYHNSQGHISFNPKHSVNAKEMQIWLTLDGDLPTLDLLSFNEDPCSYHGQLDRMAHKFVCFCQPITDVYCGQLINERAQCMSLAWLLCP